MQNIKNVVEAIGTDIGNLSRHHNELETQLRALQQFIQDLQNAPATDGSEAGETSPAPAEMVRLDYTHPFDQGRKGYITVAIPEAYRGGIGFYSVDGTVQLKGNLRESERIEVALEPNQPVSLTVIKPAKIESAGAADVAELMGGDMKNYTLNKYYTYGDEETYFPFMPDSFFKAAFGSDDHSERHRLAEPLSDSTINQITESVTAIGAATDEIRTVIENGGYLSDTSLDSHAMALGLPGYYSLWDDFETAFDDVRKLPAYLRNSYPKHLAEYREILKRRREDQHGEEIRKLVAAGAVLVD